MTRRCFIIACLLFLISCGTMKPWYAKQVREWEKAIMPDSSTLVHTVYLMGDAGDPERNRQEPSLKLFERLIREGREESTSVIWLGDNIYNAGLPPNSSAARSEAERRVNAQLATVKGFKGNVIFIPGNHDWDHSGDKGLETILRQQQYISEFMQREDVFLPGGGCPGPAVKLLEKNLLLIALDSEWWLHKHTRPIGVTSPCDVASELDFVVQLEDVLNANSDKNIIIALHHPLFSNGNHGGHYSLKDHIFPLTLVNDQLYIPLPIIGSIYPFGRMYGISRQDLSNEKYHLLKSSLLSLLAGRRNIIIAAGHEHNLQLHPYQEIFQVLSGSVTKDTYVIRGNGAEFVYNQKGFARVLYYKNNETWVEYWVPEKDGATGRVVFRKPLYAFQAPNRKPSKEPGSNYKDSIIVEAIQPKYDTRSPLKRFFLGGHYRKEWGTPVPFRHLDMEKEHGGLTPIKLGGGMQTVSLRCRGGDGREYVLRSLDKDPTAILPEGLQQTFAEVLIRDQMSASHPYGPLTLPRMSEALGILHTKPEYRFVPYTPVLGPYLGKFGGLKVMKEWRPNENAQTKDPVKYVGTPKMLEKVFEDHQHRVDAHAYARARLFDMIICDWDRHEDQWRWMVKEEKGSAVYYPFPRDRDQVYSKYDGLLPTIFTSSLGRREIQTFDDHINDVLGMNLAAKNLDRFILPVLTRQDWINLADSVIRGLTDEVIDKSMKDMPPEIYKISGEEIASHLKARRNDIKRVAERYYEILSRKVDIFLSDKDEVVKISRYGDSTRLEVFKREDGQQAEAISRRLFYHRETNELRVYCRAGADSVVITGAARGGLIVRIVPGTGNDVILDHSKVTWRGKTTRIYPASDSKVRITESRETNVFESQLPDPADIGFRDFRYNQGRSWLISEYNEDFGFSIGLQGSFTTHTFRKKPYQSMHWLSFNKNTSNGATYLEYRNSFPQLIRNIELNTLMSYTGPDNQVNYFGQGNETLLEQDIEFYRLRLRNSTLSAQLALFNEHVRLSAGPLYRFYRVFTMQSSRPNQEVRTAIAADRITELGGLKATFDVDYRDHKIYARKGIALFTHYLYQNDLVGNKYNFHKLGSEIQFYLTPNLPFVMTFSFILGGETLMGPYPFYESAFLGTSTHLRGYNFYRFAGRSSAFQNTEMRLTISRLKSIVIAGDWGLTAFIDHGKVWADNQASGILHQGYGGGLWLNLFDLSMLSGTLSRSKEGTYFRVNFNYFF